MTESFITVLLIGFFAGFIFAMPIAGPISILITSNALKGKLRFCVRTAIGASIVEFFYVLVAVFGLAILFSFYNSIIPYMLVLGSVFMLFVGIKVFNNKLELKDINKSAKKINKDKMKNKGGLRAGLIINITNPSLFFGVLTSSFLVLSFASSIGLNTGGLDLLVNENVSSLQEIAGDQLNSLDSTFTEIPSLENEPEYSSYTFILSLIYSLALATGGFVWLFILTKLLIKYRQKIKLRFLNLIIKSLGIILCGISFYLGYSGIKMFFK